MTSDIHAATQAFERALKQTWEMIDPLRPPPAGSYALGEHNGIAAAFKTMRENFERECAAATQARDAEIAALRADAERYRWLRDKANDVQKRAPMAVMVDSGFSVSWMDAIYGANLDAAIDAARSGREGA